MAEKRTFIEDIEGDEVQLDAQGGIKKVMTRVEAPQAPKRTQAPAMADWKTIIMEESDNIPPIGLFIGHNGKTYILRPGVEAKVPPGILGVLNDATMTVPKMDPNTLQVVGWRDRLRFPYRIIHDRAA